MYPFRIVYYLICEDNLEPLFFKENGVVYEGNAEQLPELLARQNPSWPHRRIPPTAIFQEPVKMMVSVPRKNFKRATDRNHIKRLVKESYRKNKSDFYTFLQSRDLRCLLAFVYTSREILPYSETENKIKLTLQKLRDEIAAHEQAKNGAGE